MKAPIEKPVAGVILVCTGTIVIVIAFNVWRAGINVLQGEILYNIGAGALLIAAAFMMGLSAVLFSLTSITNHLAQIAANGRQSKPEPEKKPEATPKTVAPLKSPPQEPSVYKL